jgi:hypothetical protein
MELKLEEGSRTLSLYMHDDDSKWTPKIACISNRRILIVPYKQVQGKTKLSQ